MILLAVALGGRLVHYPRRLVYFNLFVGLWWLEVGIGRRVKAMFPAPARPLELKVKLL